MCGRVGTAVIHRNNFADRPVGNVQPGLAVVGLAGRLIRRVRGCAEQAISIRLIMMIAVFISSFPFPSACPSTVFCR